MSKCDAGRLDRLEGRGFDERGFFTVLGLGLPPGTFLVFLAARYHFTPQALQRVLGPSGPSRHWGVEVTPQDVQMRPAKLCVVCV